MKKKLENRLMLPASFHRLSKSISTHFRASNPTSPIYSRHTLSTVPTAPIAYQATPSAYLLLRCVRKHARAFARNPLLLLYCSRTYYMNTISPYALQLPSVTSPQPSSATNKISPVYTRSTTNPLISSLLAHPLPILRCLPSLVPTTLLSAKPVSPTA